VCTHVGGMRVLCVCVRVRVCMHVCVCMCDNACIVNKTQTPLYNEHLRPWFPGIMYVYAKNMCVRIYTYIYTYIYICVYIDARVSHLLPF